MVVTVLAIVWIAVPAANATPLAAGRSVQPGPYEGVFEGLVRGDKGSHAPLRLELTHQGREVEGTVLVFRPRSVAHWHPVPAVEQYLSSWRTAMAGLGWGLTTLGRD